MTDAPKTPAQLEFFDSRGRRQQQRWIDAQRRRDEARARFHALPQEERDGIWARIDRLLFVEATWTRAKSPEYANNPHSYTKRRHWRDEDFVFVVQFIRSGVCDREKFAGRWYDVLNRVHGGVAFKVWPMGWPINHADGRPWTILLNRKPCLPTDK